MDLERENGGNLIKPEKNTDEETPTC